MLCHCVEENASGVNINLSRFEEFSNWLYTKYKNDIWFASFQDVSIYNEQINHSKINYLDVVCIGNQGFFLFRHNLNRILAQI